MYIKSVQKIKQDFRFVYRFGGAQVTPPSGDITLVIYPEKKENVRGVMMEKQLSLIKIMMTSVSKWESHRTHSKFGFSVVGN